MPQFYTQLNSDCNTHGHSFHVDTEKMNTGEAIKLLMEQRNENPYSLAPKVGIPQPTLYRIITGETKEPKRVNIEKIAKEFGVSPDDLGRGVITKLGSAQPGPVGRVSHHVIPVFDVAGSMGFGASHPENETVVDGISLTPNWIHRNLSTISSPKNLAVISGYGDSMTPTFADGDLLLIDRGVTEIKIDAIYVLSLNNELYIKRVQRRITDGAVIIKSDNNHYESTVVSNGERADLRVLGRVVWAWNGRKL